jgi:hypothetical protein
MYAHLTEASWCRSHEERKRMSGPSNPDIFTNNVICAKATKVLQYVLVSIGYTTLFLLSFSKPSVFVFTRREITKANCVGLVDMKQCKCKTITFI